MATTHFTALVLAASRSGPADAVARIQGKSHKCQVELNGVPMLLRVIVALQRTPEIGRIVICIEDQAPLQAIPEVAAMLQKGEVSFVPSRGNLAESVVQAAQQLADPYPLLITTGDAALLTPEIVSWFCAAVGRSNADAQLSLTRAEVLLEKFPTGKRAFLQFRGGGYSGCNLFALRSQRALPAAQAFAGGGQFGKNPVRAVLALGVLTFVLYKLRLITLEYVFRRFSRSIGVRVEPVLIPIAEAAIDVDNAADYALTTQILEAREGKRS